jgi:hypothetical protein
LQDYADKEKPGFKNPVPNSQFMGGEEIKPEKGSRGKQLKDWDNYNFVVIPSFYYYFKCAWVSRFG